MLEDVVLPVLLPVDAAEPEADALPDAFVEFEEPVAPELLEDLVFVAVELLADPEASVDFAPLVLDVDCGFIS